MKFRDLEQMKIIEAASPMEDVRVWQIVELFEKDEKTKQEQHSFVLASGIDQALRIVGKDERREVISARELCPITQLPQDVYRVRYLNPPTPANSGSLGPGGPGG